MRTSHRFAARPFGPKLLVRTLLAAALLVEPAWIASPVYAGEPAPAGGRALAVDAVGLTVSDADRSVEFFTNVLSFEKVSDVEVVGEPWERLQGLFGVRMRVVRLRLGSEFVELTEYLAPRGRPIPADARSNDRSFQHVAIVVSDMEKAYAHLRRHKVTHASTGPQRLPDWNPNAGGIKAFYFKDPDGHALEVIWFPKGKGDPRWQAPTERLFLGIDHTAIVVGDTDASLRFYRDTLGLQVVGGAENHGTEQEHLNNVFGARLRITALRAGASSTESGPGIEFLEYLAPRDGRPAPPDTKANDLWHWQTRLFVPKASDAEKAIRTGMLWFVSPGVVTPPRETGSKDWAFGAGFLVRDPDGHTIELRER